MTTTPTPPPPATASAPAPAEAAAAVASPPSRLDVHLHGLPEPSAPPAEIVDWSWATDLIWPLIFVLLLVFSKRLRIALLTFFENLSRFREIGIGDVKLALDTERAREYVVAYSEVVHEQMQTAFDKEAARLEIPKLLQDLIDTAVRPQFDPALAISDSDFRTTIHVHSVLYPEELYQLTEYLPRTADLARKRARRNSIRFGIIGKAWRSKETEYDEQVSSNPRDLVRDWGMTHAEAEIAGKGMQTFLAVPIEDAMTDVVAVIFVNARPAKAFPNTSNAQKLGRIIAAEAERNELRQRLIDLAANMKKELAIAPGKAGA